MPAAAGWLVYRGLLACYVLFTWHMFVWWVYSRVSGCHSKVWTLSSLTAALTSSSGPARASCLVCMVCVMAAVHLLHPVCSCCALQHQAWPNVWGEGPLLGLVNRL
jgi:hypothetical protein